MFHRRLALGEIRLGSWLVALVIQENIVSTEAVPCGFAALEKTGWTGRGGSGESSVVKAEGVLLGISPPADAGRGDAGEGACVLGEYHLVKSGRGLCKNTAVTPSPASGWGHQGG